MTDEQKRDLLQAIDLLDACDYVDTWELVQITNDEHALDPRGTGFGLTVLCAVPRKTGAPELMRVFEKAGTGRSLFQAAQVAIRRLEERIVGWPRHVSDKSPGFELDKAHCEICAPPEDRVERRRCVAHVRT